MNKIGFFQILVRMIFAVIFSGIIGWERERLHKPAGFRTHILVCLGSTLFMLVSIFMYQEFRIAGADPGRIAAQVVTGIGFLGAGTIWMASGSVKGLTTAASLWTVAAIGLAVGVGFYSGAFLGTITAFIVLRVIQRFEDHWHNNQGGLQ